MCASTCRVAAATAQSQRWPAEMTVERAAWEGAVTFWRAWRRSVDAAPDAPFLTFERPDGGTASWTYGEFDDLVSRVAAFLAARGVDRGAAVHLALTNSP